MANIHNTYTFLNLLLFLCVPPWCSLFCEYWLAHAASYKMVAAAFDIPQPKIHNMHRMLLRQTIHLPRDDQFKEAGKRFINLDGYSIYWGGPSKATLLFKQEAVNIQLQAIIDQSGLVLGHFSWMLYYSILDGSKHEKGSQFWEMEDTNPWLWAYCAESFAGPVLPEVLTGMECSGMRITHWHYIFFKQILLTVAPFCTTSAAPWQMRMRSLLTKNGFSGCGIRYMCV